jgi:hypothetical protein
LRGLGFEATHLLAQVLESNQTLTHLEYGGGDTTPCPSFAFLASLRKNYFGTGSKGQPYGAELATALKGKTALTHLEYVLVLGCECVFPPPPLAL